jgi:outer membrane protein assembly factor BamA
MKRVHARAAGFAMALAVSGAARAAEVTPAPPAATATVAARPWDYAALPVLFYAPETSLGLAAGFTIFDDAPAPPDRPRRDDQVTLIFQGTLRKQYGVSLEGTKYWRDGRYRLEEGAVTLRFPNYFWGIGNNTPEDARDLYTMATTQARTTFTTRIWEEIYLGEGVTIGHYRTTEVEPGGSVAQYLTTHPSAGVLFGGGPVLRRDTRDDAMGPHRGSFTSLSTTFFRKGWLSDFSYQIWELDQRVYVPLGNSVLGLQAYGRYAGGAPPLDEMSALGGGSRLRGYFEGRYRDRLYMMAQAEWRVRVWKRLSLAPFGAVGNVFPSFSAIGTEDTKVAGGMGVRVSLKQERDVNIRLDLAVSPISTGVYLNLGEAF